MKMRTIFLCLSAMAGVIGTVAVAWCHEAGTPGGAPERAQVATLKLGEEMPPPRPVEDQFTRILVDGALEPMKQQAAKIQGDPQAGKVQRDQHPKHHGCVRATFTVADGLPEALRVGVFRVPRTYPAVIRFSNGRAQVDNVPDAHGMAIKLIGVEGPSLLEGEADAGSQDFILIDHPVFFAVDPKNLVEFTGARKELEQAKAAGDTARIKSIVERFPTQFTILRAMGKLGTPSPLEMTYHSEVPYRLGAQAMKFSAVPGPENASGRPELTPGSPEDALRTAMVDHLTTKKKPATFAFQVRIQTDPVKMPVEDPTVLWDSDPVTVATIAIEPQEFARKDQLDFCEDLSFTPWHSIEAHRPIGGINRARKPVYQATSIFRHEKNNVPRKEPTVADLDRLFPAK